MAPHRALTDPAPFPTRRGGCTPPRSLAAEGCGLGPRAGLILLHAFVDLVDGALMGVSVLLLKQARQDIELAGGSIQIVVGELAPPGLGLAANLLPFPCQHILVHQ